MVLIHQRVQREQWRKVTGPVAGSVGLGLDAVGRTQDGSQPLAVYALLQVAVHIIAQRITQVGVRCKVGHALQHGARRKGGALPLKYEVEEGWHRPDKVREQLPDHLLCGGAPLVLRDLPVGGQCADERLSGRLHVGVLSIKPRKSQLPRLHLRPVD